MIMTIVRVISLILIAVAAWNFYQVYAGGAQRDILNISTIIVQGGLGVLVFMKDIITGVASAIKSGVAKMPKTDPKTDVPTDMISDMVKDWKDKESNTNTVPVDPTCPRNLKNQQEILTAINTLYDHFQGDPVALAIVANIAKAFAAKCYPVETKQS